MGRRFPFAVALLAATSIFALSGCGSAATDAGSDAVGTWGQEAQGQPQLVLAEDGNLTGTDGCNRLMGGWSQEGDVVTFTQVASTMMACEDVDTWLAGLATATVSGDTLTVLDESGAEIGTLDR